MTSPILVTKLFIPATRPKLVSRPRLIEQLDGGLYRKLILVSAPAGFGKTTLVTEWLQTLRENPATYIAWLSLDEGDNDPTRFLTYLIAALNRIDALDSLGDGSLTMLGSPQPLALDVVLTPLINEIATTPGQLILVLDDYHIIENQAVNAALNFLLENLPPHVHLVMTTREDPLLPLSRLRVRGQLTELRAADLRFSTTEATEFLNQVMGLDLLPEDIAALERRTEGWIAGLQLAAISMQGQSEPSRLVQSFTGSNRLVLDYLIDEVLQRQSPAIQDFLLNTAVLSRLNGPLCDAVRFGIAESTQAHDNSQAVLEMLERANLFVIPLDNDRQWYRYHHLFADLLRQRLRQIKPEQAPILHSRASAWYEQNDLVEESIEHALQAGDFKRSAALIANLADDLWKRGEHLKLRGWLEKLSEEWVCIQPQLCIYHAWFLFSTGHQEEAEFYLQAAEQALATGVTQEYEITSSQPEPSSGPDRTQLAGRLSAIRALSTSWGEDFPAMIQYAKSALDALPKQDPWRSMAELVLGDAYFYEGDMQASYQARLKTLEACQADDNLFFYMIANLKVATSLREMGFLEQAIEICQGQLEFARKNGLSQTIFAGWAMGLLGLALAERNEFEKALELTNEYVELAKGNDLGFVGSSYMFKAKSQFYAGDFEGAEKTLNELAILGQKHYLPHYISGALKAWQGRIYLAQNQLEAASQLIDERDFKPDEGFTLVYDDVIVVRARLLLVQENFTEASRVLKPLIEATEAGGSTVRLIEVLVLQSLAKQGEGEMTLALQYLARTLSLAEAGGFIRVFVDEGSSMARLLYEALSQGIAPDYVQRLLAAFPEVEAEQPKPGGFQISGDEWIEPLSERELDIIKLIAEGLTNQEIASKLYLSLNTVKAHTRNIYGKLGVKSRTQAATKARTLGILSDH
jgi:LuxR family maltose regulon positive regulatory protein